MAALTAARDAREKDGRLLAYPVGAAKTIYKGGLVVVATGTGYAEAATDAASKAFVGVAYEDADNASGGAGDLTCRVKKSGAFLCAASGAAQTWVGQSVYVVDDQTVALAATTTNDVLVGTVVEFVGATQVRVLIDNAVK